MLAVGRNEERKDEGSLSREPEKDMANLEEALVPSGAIAVPELIGLAVNLY